MGSEVEVEEQEEEVAATVDAGKVDEREDDEEDGPGTDREETSCDPSFVNFLKLDPGKLLLAD